MLRPLVLNDVVLNPLRLGFADDVRPGQLIFSNERSAFTFEKGAERRADKLLVTDGIRLSVVCASFSLTGKVAYAS